MDDDTSMDGLPAARQPIIGAEPRQGGHPRSRIGRPALHRVAGALTSKSSASQTAYEAGAPGTRVPVTPSRTPPARHAPRVAAANAARAETALPGVRCRVAARTVAHGFMPVTGVSEPKARGTPWDANSANGLSRMPPVDAEALRIHAVARRPTRRRNWVARWRPRPTARAGRPARPSPSPGVPAGARSGRRPARRNGRRPARRASTTAADRRVADDVETRRDARLGAGRQVRGDRVGVQVAVASHRVARARRCRARAATRCANRGRRRRTGRRPARARRCVSISSTRLLRAGHRLHPSSRRLARRGRWRAGRASRRGRRCRGRRIRGPRRCRGRPRSQARRCGRVRRCSGVSRSRAAARTR